ncbi:amidohydrolase [Natronosalvus halobius]|uniref:amidohydrolase n=1 Tax=Natronosalvus halobius TaxID=2953746 RepID=UPI00209FD461|nr:amidohydrolase [Natronosalvus halobius]USZ70771.1 amidohydrolase [Natronosalvus halobius]
MTEAADTLLVDARVYSLADVDGTDPDAPEPNPTEALAIRDGEIVHVGREYEVRFLEGVETNVIDCEGRPVLPGFIDAHTHVENLGQYLVHADLSAAETLEGALDALATHAGDASDREWLLGFGYDESEWPENRYLSASDLDAVSEDRPVVAMRVDMHTASLNSVALERLTGSMPDDDVETEGDDPTGVVVEEATEAVWDAIEPDYAETRDLVIAALEHANVLGVTSVHDKVRQSHAPRVYRDLEAAGELTCRVRLDYWSDHLESVLDAGLATNGGSEFVEMGGIKSFTDGSFGGRTAKLFEPYADLPGDGGDSRDDGNGGGGGVGNGDSDGDDNGDSNRDDPGAGRGQWVVDPDELEEIAAKATAEGDYQLTVHAIGDEAIEETISAFEATANGGSARHRVEHVELATDDHLERMAEAGIVASVQPNFLQWAGEGGLYDQRLGVERRERTNRYRSMLEAGVPLAFGSDCMPLDPLLGVHHAVNAPVEAQRLSVTAALRAYTAGAAYAGFDEGRLGTLEVSKKADITVLEASPWDRPEQIDEIDVAMTLVDGAVVHDAGLESS